MAPRISIISPLECNISCKHQKTEQDSVFGELKLIIIARAVIHANSFPSFNNYLANHMMLLDKLMGLPQSKRVDWP